MTPAELRAATRRAIEHFTGKQSAVAWDHIEAAIDAEVAAARPQWPLDAHSPGGTEMSETPTDAPEPSEAALYQAFVAWFKQGGCDFWSESNAPEELAEIAARVIADATKSRDETIAALQEQVNILNASRYEAIEAAVAKERARCLRLVENYPTALTSIEINIRSGREAL